MSHFCKRCAAVVPDLADSCHNCGTTCSTTITHDTRSGIVCGQCNHLLDINAFKCENCGNPDPFGILPRKSPPARPKHDRHNFWPLWEEREMEVINEIAVQDDVTPAEVIKAAVRLYQAHKRGAATVIWPHHPGLPALEL